MRLSGLSKNGLQKYSVMIIDDEQGIIDSIAVFLDKDIYNVIGFTDPLKAINHLREKHCDILILDFLLEAMTGKQVLEQIRSFNRELFVILLTGHADLAPPIKMLHELDIQGYCEKGMNFDQLILMIESAVKAIDLNSRLTQFHKGMALLLKNAPKLFELRPLDAVLSDIHMQAIKITKSENSFVVEQNETPSNNNETSTKILGCGTFEGDSPSFNQTFQVRYKKHIDNACKIRQLLFAEDGIFIPLTNQLNDKSFIIYCECAFSEELHHLLTIFHGNALAAFNNAILHSVVQNKNFELKSLLTNLEENIEKQKKLENELRQSQKMDMLGRMAGSIAHDFNNVLTVISGYSDILLKKVDSHSQEHLKITHIFNAASHASDLVKQLLAFSRRQILERTVISLNDLVQSFQKMLTYICGMQIDIRLDFDKSLWPIYGDKTQIEQVIMNLVVNARDAMPNGGLITIGAKNISAKDVAQLNKAEMKPVDYVLFFVKDTGCGMDRNTIEKIFEPFFTTKEQGKGTGLGLSTVYGIVKQIDGYIYVDSIQKHGTTFSLYLPRSIQTIQNTADEKLLPEINAEEKTILVVDDQEELRSFVTMVLSENGYRVFEAALPSQAITIFENNPIDLVVTDMVMPEMNGRELCKHLSKIRRNFKILFMSGYLNNDLNSLGFYSSQSNFLQKPFKCTELLTMIAKVFRDPSVTEEAN